MRHDILLFLGGSIRLKKILLPLMVVVALVFTIVPPAPAQASKVDELNRELKKIEQQIKNSQSQIKKAEQEIKTINKKEKEVEKEINTLSKEIDKTLKLIEAKEKEIKMTENNLLQTAAELEEAEKRVEDRDSLLRSRVRLMYTNGAVSYLDVLFSATSFSDFLDRYRSLSLIVDQDKTILAENIKDKNFIADAKVQIETDLAFLRKAYAELENEKQSLEKKQNDRKVMIAQLHERKEHLEDISEEQEKALNDASKLKSKLYAEIVKLMEHEGKFIWPLKEDYPITSNFGYRIHPISKVKKLHAGTDIGAPKGAHVVAAGSGVVITAKYWGGYGNAIMIDHGNGMWTLYAHLNKIRVKEGDKVKAGQHIGDVGTTGSSTGYHLHYEVRKNSEPVDAMKYTLKFAK